MPVRLSASTAACIESHGGNFEHYYKCTLSAIIYNLNVCGHMDFVSFLGWDESEFTWYVLPLFGLLCQLLIIDDDGCGAVGGMKIGRGN
jgi:hypothetical protein